MVLRGCYLVNPFDLVSAITDTKQDVLESEKDYNAFMVNRALSYYVDTVLLADEMNLHSHLDGRMQFDFLMQAVKKRRRFSRWHKDPTRDRLKRVTEVFGCSITKARELLEVLTEEQLLAMEVDGKEKGVSGK